MIHYTCDRCRRVIDSEEELRFEVNIVTEIKLDNSASSGPGELARQQLDEIIEISPQSIDDGGDDLFQTQRFDLCAACYREYARNPLATDPQVQVQFSEN